MRCLRSARLCFLPHQPFFLYTLHFPLLMWQQQLLPLVSINGNWIRMELSLFRLGECSVIASGSASTLSSLQTHCRPVFPYLAVSPIETFSRTSVQVGEGRQEFKGHYSNPPSLGATGWKVLDFCSAVQLITKNYWHFVVVSWKNLRNSAMLCNENRVCLLKGRIVCKALLWCYLLMCLEIVWSSWECSW